jgi:isopenicillin-N N-acyltransferase-like protein
MIARHLSVEHDPFRRGAEFGREHRDAVHRTVQAYEKLFAAVHDYGRSDIAAAGVTVSAALDRECPELASEIAGIASGADVQADLLMALNARTEVLAGVSRPECSALGALPSATDGGTVIAQNWDWHPDVRSSLVLWTVPRADGGWFTTFTEAGILAKIGLNSHGVGVCLNILGSSADGGLDGVPIHILLRLLLQSCQSLEDADRLLRRARVTASSCFNVGWSGAEEDGASVAAFEVSPGGVVRLEPEHGVVLHTNHFVVDPPSGRDRILPEWPDTAARLDELKSRVAERAVLDVPTIQELLRSHDAGPIAICCHDSNRPTYADRQESLASIVMRLDDRSLEISEGPPCSNPYQEFLPLAAVST